MATLGNQLPEVNQLPGVLFTGGLAFAGRVGYPEGVLGCVCVQMAGVPRAGATRDGSRYPRGKSCIQLVDTRGDRSAIQLPWEGGGLSTKALIMLCKATLSYIFNFNLMNFI